LDHAKGFPGTFLGEGLQYRSPLDDQMAAELLQVWTAADRR
jgi:hypothetical protein